ncbi:MAG: beta-ketoacyl synthase N-terminal-like domain-containing protein [Cytophagales bacterium]|nr:beta-ketoacyl synthase N-terminal-like domain-containing protein [Cytophagales bacterium]
MTITGMEIAVIGMACRFPKSRNIQEFWEHIRAGDELVTQFSDEDLKTFGVDPKIKADPGYVAAEAIVDEPGHFDAAFFGIPDSDAMMMDPQQRLMLEVSWNAMEDGGYVPKDAAQNCGVFVSGGNNKYHLENILTNPEKMDEIGDFQVEIGNSVNFLATRISYLFNLTGPASVVQTACSSSLVAIHYACQALLNGECDLALGGGSKVAIPQQYGHVYTEGGVKSKEGHCRVFDQEASGFVNGNGCGMVLLKRLEDALEDGDQIYGMVKGSALNNDGSEKIGYTAPSILGQQQVIREALDMAEVTPESISYIEAHGTGTKLGDPIEIDGLKHVFQSDQPHCALGSVKANMGHLDAAAGVAGFIKAILTLHHREICPQINFNVLNPAIQLDGSPFYIATAAQSRKKQQHPFRAGVSSFGIGGTNAHVVLEEAPRPVGAPITTPEGYSLITFSGKTEAATTFYAEKLASFLTPETNLSDLSSSLWHQKAHFQYRTAVVAKTFEALNQALKDTEASVRAYDRPKIYFLFPGQGSQYTHMTRELYDQNLVYRTHLDICLKILHNLSGTDFKEILFSTQEEDERIHETQYAQPLVFAVEYALAKVFADMGVVPDAMIGHSLGEFTAACLSETLSLEASLELVLIRSRLMQSMPRGSMVSVSLNGERKFLEALPESLQIAAINSESNYVISGDTPAVALLEEQLAEKSIKHRRLKTSHAYHSPMMAGMLDAFESAIKKFDYQPPKIPFVSNLTGEWVSSSDISADYWKRHVKHPVRFLDGIRLLDQEEAVFIEVGPGSALSYLSNQTLPDKSIVNLIPPNAKSPEPLQQLYEGLGKIWELGVPIDLTRTMHSDSRRIRIPGYAFDHKKHWLEPGTHSKPFTGESTDELTYIPYWKRIHFSPDQKLKEKNLLVIGDNIPERLIKALRENCKHLTLVKSGKRFRVKKDAYSLDFDKAVQCEQLLTALKEKNLLPQHIIHGLSITKGDPRITVENAGIMLNQWYYSLLNLLRALGPYSHQGISVDVLTNGVFSVLGNEQVTPLKATLAGPVKVAPFEYEGLRSRLIECSFDDWKRYQPLGMQNLVDYLQSDHQPGMKMVALRGNTFWEQAYQSEKIQPKQDPFRQKGVYLITGGFGGMGSTIAKFLAENYQAKVALFSSSSIPPREQWDLPLNEKDQQKVSVLRSIDELGGEVMSFAVNIADHSSMKEAFADICSSWGDIHGIIHTAGKADYGGILSNRTNGSIHEILESKVHGHLVLKSLSSHLALDFFINFSSIGNQIYGKKFGQIGYNSANEYLDACATINGPEQTLNWCDWLDVGMTFEAVKKKNDLKDARAINAKVIDGISPEQGAALFKEVLSGQFSQTLISPMDFLGFIAASNTQEVNESAAETHESTGYSQVELIEKLTGLYESFFGIEQLDTEMDFNDLGGDSLKAVVLLARIKKKLKVQLTLSDFYEQSSVTNLSAFLATEKSEAAIPIKAERFLISSDANQLFGTHYSTTSKQLTPVIICPPVFQEEIVATRAMDTLSEQLAMLHYPVVRFDFSGMGNSEGEALKLTLTQWQQNLLDVIKETIARYSSDKVHLIGLRMGASLMNNMKEELAPFVDQQCYWHPIIKGQEYLKSLNKYQQIFMKGSFADPSGNDPKGSILEYNSYQISADLKQSINDFKFQLSGHPGKKETIIVTPHNRSLQVEKVVNFIVSESLPFWNKLATEKGYVPEKDIEAIIQWSKNLIS